MPSKTLKQSILYRLEKDLKKLRNREASIKESITLIEEQIVHVRNSKEL